MGLEPNGKRWSPVLVRHSEEKLRVDPQAEAQAKLKGPELHGATASILITKLGAKPNGKADDLRAHVARLLAGNGRMPLLALPAPAQRSLPAPTPSLALR